LPSDPARAVPAGRERASARHRRDDGWGRCHALPILVISLFLTNRRDISALASILTVCPAGLLLAAIPRVIGKERLTTIVAQGQQAATAQTTLRWSIVLLLVLLVLAAGFGLDVVLGALIAGIVLRTATMPLLIAPRRDRTRRRPHDPGQRRRTSRRRDTLGGHLPPGRDLAGAERTTGVEVSRMASGDALEPRQLPGRVRADGRKPGIPPAGARDPARDQRQAGRRHTHQHGARPAPG